MNDPRELAKLQVLERLEKVETLLKSSDPMIGIHCQNIHKALLEHEELIHILPDEKIRIFMAGMQKWKNVQLIKEASKSRSKSLSKTTADDL